MKSRIASSPLLLALATGCAASASDPGPPMTDCDATHERVGWTAELTGYFHDVAGTVEAVDDCTLELREFTFDGTGLNVRFVTSTDPEFGDYTSLSEDLRLSGGYAGDTLSFPLTEGMSLDDVDFVSIWCVPAGANFGDGPLVPPAG